LRDWRRGLRQWIRPSFEAYGAQPMSASRLASLCRASGLEVVQTVAVTDEAPALERIRWPWIRKKLAPQLLFRCRRTD
jgi:hypothetical protein